MIIKFVFNGLKSLYFLTKRKEVDRITNTVSTKCDVAVFGIHGTLMTYYNAFYPMARFFSKEKIPFIPLDYDYKEDPEKICNKLFRKISRIQYKKIIFVGHSYGGIIIRYLVRKYFEDSKKVMIITLDAPNNGINYEKCSFLKRIIYKFAGVRDAEVKGSEVLNHLRQFPFKKVKIVSIVGGSDYLLPEESAMLNSKKPDIKISGEDHISILFSKNIFEIIKRIVTEDEL